MSKVMVYLWTLAASSRATKSFFLFCFILSLLLCPVAAYSQSADRTEIPSSFNPVGSGARALGMGGAFISVADDATAASWNPGGLIQLEHPEVSVVGAIVKRTEENYFPNNPEASGKGPVFNGNLNYLSATYPFVLLDRNMVLSLNYQYLYDMNRKWNFSLYDSSTRYVTDYRQSGNLSALGLAYCIQITPFLSAGFTLNFWANGFGLNQWTQKYHDEEKGVTLTGKPYTYAADKTERYTLSGFNTNLGLLWNVNDRITVGAVLKTPFKAKIRHSITKTYDFSTSPSSADFNKTGELSLEDSAHLLMPMSYGMGISYRFSDRFTLSGDFYRTQWNDFVLTDSQGNRISPVTGRSAEESQISATNQIRLGVEYLIIRPNYLIPLRAGVFYDPAPARGSPDDYYGFTVGTGYARGKFVFDIAYQFRYGNNVGGSILQNLDFSQDIKEHMVYMSLVYYIGQ